MTRNDITIVEELSEAVCRQLPALSVEEQRAGIVLLRELAGGDPVVVAQFARARGTPVEKVETLMSDSALTPFIHKDEGGRIQGFWGLSVTPTHHQLTVSGRALWAWCAQDSLFLPELLGATAEIESRDPETGALARLTVSPARVEAVVPTGVLGVDGASGDLGCHIGGPDHGVGLPLHLLLVKRPFNCG